MSNSKLKTAILMIICGIIEIIFLALLFAKDSEFIMFLPGILLIIIGIILLGIYLKEKSEFNNSLWNKFIDQICSKDLDDLSTIQKNAVLCFLYDTEMESGGHSGFFSIYEDMNYQDLEKAICVVANKKIADNFKEALVKGKKDDYVKTDEKYYSYSPSLVDYLEEYVEKNKEKIFKQ